VAIAAFLREGMKTEIAKLSAPEPDKKE